MGLMILIGAEESIGLLVLLVAVLGLTFWETRERSFNRQLTTWWLLLVALTHVIGYIALRIWLMTRDPETR